MGTFEAITIRDENTTTTGRVESNGGQVVSVRDRTSSSLDLKFIQAQGAPTALSANADPDDKAITVVSTTGFVDDNVVGVFSGTGMFYFGRQIGAPSGNVINLDTPIDRAFLSGDSVITAIDNMAVDGSSTTQIFQIGPVGVGTGVEVDITRFNGYLEDGTAMTDDKFGGMLALTCGVVLRVNSDVITNKWNVKKNGDIGLLCFDFNYTDRAGGSNFGARFRNSYGGQAKHGVVIRLAPGDILEVLIQDDLTDLVEFTMMAQGHIVET